ncbi:pyrroline-5-carboxylate reductase [Ligilactobacillus salitolerans]|uniref:Pyrroline-5-carboxylate reductase n=1 Tax=Ligilactobacillus salitolerans TaxID=1808352 RepID=A0A401IVC0_9LACO|nr:pyrroline-5-carboxylate reductase [Ligilactobacillus salitolerans]GBG95500.1 pyrroline-5-carboxylate reductase [Ligilactobacillus salitolerans]
MKVGFIGVGNMAQALIKGLLHAQAVSGSEIFIHSAHRANYEPYAAKYDLHACADNSEVVTNSDYVFLAVKPLAAGPILAEIKPALLQKKPVVLSMLTGVKLSELENFVGESDIEFLRIMPNVNVAINQGATALVGNAALTKEHLSAAQKLLAALGQTTALSEKDFSTFVALAGSSPAYVYFYIDAMAKTGVKYGLTKKQAVQIAAQAVLGSAANVLASDKSPQDLIDDVCSPGGTTISGLLAMEEAGFMTAVIKGIDVTIAKDQQ